MAVLAGLLMITCPPLHAYTVVYDPSSSSIVNRIDNLVINVPGFGGTYDVVFTPDSFNSIQPSGSYPIYDQDLGSTVASDVVDVILGVLNTTNASKVGVSIGASGGYNSGIFYLPLADGLIDPVNTLLGYRGRYLSTTGPWENLDTANIDKRFADSFITVALVPVPLPAAAWLFGSGLLGLIEIARRKNPA
jgi:hypothetical protein